MLFIAFLIIVLLVIIIFFSFPQLSPIPYFPSNKKDLKHIIKSLSLKNNQTIIDLGAGDGIVIFEAAKKSFEKKLNTKFIAVEINPILVLILNFRKLLNPNHKNIKIVWGDLFKMSLRPRQRRGKQSRYNKIASPTDIAWDSHNDNQTIEQFNNVTIYLYISPWFLENVSKKILSEFPKAKIVSYMYPIKTLKKKEKMIRAKNKIYLY